MDRQQEEPGLSNGWTRSELFNLVSLSGTLAGLCVTIVAFIKINGKSDATIVDDALAVCAATFVSCIFLLFWAIRHTGSRRAERLVKVVDTLFLAALTVMTLTGFVMVYSVW